MLRLSCRRGRFNRGKYLGQFRIAGVKYLGSFETAELKDLGGKHVSTIAGY